MKKHAVRNYKNKKLRCVKNLMSGGEGFHKYGAGGGVGGKYI